MLNRGIGSGTTTLRACPPRPFAASGAAAGAGGHAHAWQCIQACAGPGTDNRRHRAHAVPCKGCVGMPGWVPCAVSSQSFTCILVNSHKHGVCPLAEATEGSKETNCCPAGLAGHPPSAGFPLESIAQQYSYWHSAGAFGGGMTCMTAFSVPPKSDRATWVGGQPTSLAARMQVCLPPGAAAR